MDTEKKKPNFDSNDSEVEKRPETDRQEDSRTKGEDVEAANGQPFRHPQQSTVPDASVNGD